MDEDYFMEELAEEAIKGFEEFIDVESQFIMSEHDFSEKLMSIDLVIGHIDERLSSDAKNLHKLNEEITLAIEELTELMKSERFKDIKLLGEERKVKESLEKNTEHRDWRLVKENLEEGIDDEKKVIRLEKNMIKELHSHFMKILKLMKRSRLIKAVNDDKLSASKDTISKEEYYFLQAYRFFRSYERIFRHLWRKEKKIMRSSDKNYKKIKKS